MAEFTTNIKGYTVELDTDHDGCGTTQCDVSRYDYSASLACLSSTGDLINEAYCMTHRVPSHILEEIEAWADANGY